MKTFGEFLEGKKPGLWDNIHKKRKRIKAGSGEKMRKPGSEGAPTAQDFKDASEAVEMCSDKCCGQPVTECKCGPDCEHCDCYEKNMQETKGAPKGFHFTRDGKLKRGDAGADGPGGDKLRSDPLDKQRSKIPPVTEEWVSPKPHEEHDEVHTQRQVPKGTYPDHVHKMLDHLSDKNNYKNAMSSAKTMKINPIKAKTISNTDAGRKPTNTTFEKEKADRVKKQMASGKPMQKPIVLHDTHSGHTHLLAGNTRLTMNTHHGSKITPVHAITYDSSKMKKEDVSENFMDGKGPGKSGDAARHGLKGKSKSELKKIRSSETASKRKKQLAHWLLNMHHKEEVNKDFTMTDIRKLMGIEEAIDWKTIEKAFKDVYPGDIEAGTNKLLKRYKKSTPGQ